jgi:hypothetical protein
MRAPDGEIPSTFFTSGIALRGRPAHTHGMSIDVQSDPRRGSLCALACKSLLYLLLGSAILSLDSSAAMAQEVAVGEIDACGLLSSEDIATDLEKPVGPPQRKDFGPVKGGAYSSVCMWSIDGEARRFVILNVIRWPTGKAMAKQYLDAFYTAAAKGDIPHQPVPRSLGDQALWWGDGLAVREGDVSFGISVFAPRGERKGGEIEEVLAHRVLEALERLSK